MPRQISTGFFVYPGGGSSRSSGYGAPSLAFMASLCLRAFSNERGRLPVSSVAMPHRRLACAGVPSPPPTLRALLPPRKKKSGGHGTSPVAHRRLAVCRGQPPPDCRQRPKMGASRSQVPLAAGLLDGSEGAALGRAKRMAIVWPTATSTTPDAGHREQ